MRLAELRTDDEIDIEARAGMMGSEGYQDNAIFEMQPRLSMPLYYEPPAIADHGGHS
jgi:hypothetical protein